MGQYRMERLNVQLRDEISKLILRGEIRDPRVSGKKSGLSARKETVPFLSVNRVDVSQDLSYAKVYVSSFATDGTLERGVEGLNNAAGFIQCQIAKKLRIRKFPKLTFIVDSGMKYGFNMIRKLTELENESKRAVESFESNDCENPVDFNE